MDIIDTLIEIRAKLNLSQTELAELLNVSYATVNRWENGRAVPAKVALKKIKDLCREKNIEISMEESDDEHGSKE